MKHAEIEANNLTFLIFFNSVFNNTKSFNLNAESAQYHNLWLDLIVSRNFNISSDELTDQMINSFLNYQYRFQQSELLMRQTE